MQRSFFSIALLWWLLDVSMGVIIKPNSNNPFIDVSLPNDPRNKNKVKNNQWHLFQDWDNPLNDWGLILTADSEKYGFRRGAKSSKITIEINGLCPGNKNEECDAYWGFSFGSNDYIAFFNDFDGYLHVNDGPTNKRQKGIFSFPKCGQDVSTGDISKNIKKGKVTFNGLRSAVAGGDDENWNLLSSKQNGDTWPVKFILDYNDKTKTLTLKFISSTFPNGLTCSFKPKRPLTSPGLDFKLLLSPDGGDETIKIKSFKISGTNTGVEDECKLDLNSYLDRCVCDNRSPPPPPQQRAVSFGHPEDTYFNGQPSYDKNAYNNPNDNNYNLLMAVVVSNLFLTIIMFNYIICTRKRDGSYFGGGRGKYVAVSVESDNERIPMKS